jgi:uncharacterized membrane protein
MGVSYKFGISCHGDELLILAINGLLWMVCGLGYYTFLERRGPAPRETWTYGLLSGVLVCGIVLFLMLALRCGEASTVLPIAQLSFLFTAVLGVLFLQERLTRRKIAGFSLALLCIVFMVANQ